MAGREPWQRQRASPERESPENASTEHARDVVAAPTRLCVATAWASPDDLRVPKDEQAGATLAANVRRYRSRAGLSQEQLALSADLHINAVSFIERGLRDPKVSTLVALARGLTRACPAEPVTVADLVADIDG